MISIVKQPAEICFSRNPIWWGFQTDNLWANIGTLSTVLLAFPNGPMEDDESFDLSYNGNLLSFVIKDYPDESGLQIRSGQNHPLLEDLTILEWCNQFIAALDANFLISRDFDIELDLTGIDPRVKLSGKNADPKYDITLSEQANVSLTVLENGVAKSRHPNFKLWLEIWVENADHTGYDKVFTDQPLDVDDSGLAYPNISKTLTESILGINNDFERPDPALPVLQRNRKTCRRYYLRYAEVYGSIQKVKSITTTSPKWVLLGGTGKVNEHDYSISTTFLVDGYHKFLKQEALQKTVTIKQCEWLSMVWLDTPPATVKLHIKTYFTSGDPVEHEVYSVTDALKYDKITYPAGPTQLNLTALYPDKVITKYEAWLVDGSAVQISEKRTYVLNYEYKPYTRWYTYLSSFGTYDTFSTTGKASSEYDLTTQRASLTKSIDFSFSDGETLEFDSKLELKELVLTGWITRRELKRYRDFFLSWDKFQIRNEQIFPVMVNTRSIKELKDGENLFALEFETGYRNVEELWSEDSIDITSSVTVGQFLPAIINPDVVDYDHLYYRKTQTCNKAEIDAFVLDLLTTEATHHAAQQGLIDALALAVAAKADLIHFHDERYLQIADFNEWVDIFGAAILYQGAFNSDFTIDPTDVTVLPGYYINHIVDYAGTFWRSLFGDDEEPNEAIPGTDPTKWEKIIEAKTQLSITEPVTLDWQAGNIPGKTYTWAQKYGNDLPGTAGAWWDNGTKWERFEGFQMDPTYDGATLLTVAITADLYPVKINLI